MNEGMGVEFDAQDVALRALLSGITGGDEGAMSKFYQATASRVHTLALRITAQPQAAEEVAADVYLQVWRQAQFYDASRGKVTTWLYTLCRSRALDHLRRRDLAITAPDPHDLGAEQAHEDTDPMEALLSLESDSAVHAALRVLPALERQLLTLAFFKGLTHEEIAGQVEMPLGSIKTVIRRAIKSLRLQLKVGETALKRPDYVQ